MSSSSLSDIVGRIYDCALDPTRWESALSWIMGALQCASGQVFLNDLRRHRTFIQRHVGVEPYWLEAQQRYLPDIHARMEQWHDGGRSLEEPLVLSRHLSPAAIAGSRYFQQWYRPQGFVDVIEATLIWSPTRWSGMCLRRHKAVGVFGEEELEFMRILTPHFRRAVTISNALDAEVFQKARMERTLNALKLGVILADANSRLLYVNKAAEEMMRRCGLIRDKGGFLRAEGPASAEIRTAIHCAAQNETEIGKSGLAVRLTKPDESPVVAHVLPLANGDVRTGIDPEAVAAVFINSPMEETSCAEAISRTFKLTPAESRVLYPILAGRTVPEAAADLDVAATTARTHLNSIFAKTGVSRQSELIKLAASVAPATL